MSKYTDAIPEAIREHDAFKGIEDTGALATAFHTKMTAEPAGLHDQLPEDMRAATALKDIKDIPGLAKNFLDLQNHLGNSLRIPSDEAGEEDWKTFTEKVMTKVPQLMYKPDGADETQMAALYKSLGVPENEDGYDLGEDIKVNDDSFAAIRKVAHENNFNNDQLRAVATVLMSMNGDIESANTSAQEAEMAELSTNWGAATDEKMAAVIKLAEQTKAPEGLINALKEKQAGLETYKWLDSMVKSLTGGEGINFTNETNTPTGMIPAEAKTRIAEVYANPKHPFMDNNHPQHTDWIKPGGEMTKLQRLASPKGSV